MGAPSTATAKYAGCALSFEAVPPPPREIVGRRFARRCRTRRRRPAKRAALEILRSGRSGSMRADDGGCPARLRRDRGGGRAPRMNAARRVRRATEHVSQALWLAAGWRRPVAAPQPEPRRRVASRPSARGTRPRSSTPTARPAPATSAAPASGVVVVAHRGFAFRCTILSVTLDGAKLCRRAGRSPARMARRAAAASPAPSANRPRAGRLPAPAAGRAIRVAEAAPPSSRVARVRPFAARIDAGGVTVCVLRSPDHREEDGVRSGAPMPGAGGLRARGPGDPGPVGLLAASTRAPLYCLDPASERTSSRVASSSAAGTGSLALLSRSSSQPPRAEAPERTGVGVQPHADSRDDAR